MTLTRREIAGIAAPTLGFCCFSRCEPAWEPESRLWSGHDLERSAFGFLCPQVEIRQNADAVLAVKQFGDRDRVALLDFHAVGAKRFKVRPRVFVDERLNRRQRRAAEQRVGHHEQVFILGFQHILERFGLDARDLIPIPVNFLKN